MILRALILTILLACGGATAALAAGPIFWDWPEGLDLGDVELDGAALDAEGALVRGLTARHVAVEGPEVFWCAAPDGAGGYYAGGGHAGLIHRIDGAGAATLVAEVPSAEVFSLLPGRDGALLAGCGSEGRVYRIDRAGIATELGTVPGGYVWAMLADDERGGAWLATGSPAAVWRLGPGGELTEFLVLEAQNVLDLTWDGQGRLLAATQGPGLVYRLDPDDSASVQVIFEAPQNEARQFVTGPGGVPHVLALEVGEDDVAMPAADGPNGSIPATLLQALNGHARRDVARSAIYALGPDERVEAVWSGNQDLMIAGWSERWGWLGGTVLPEEGDEARLLKLLPPAGAHPVAGWPGGDVLDLLVTDERIVACQAHPGGLTELLSGVDGAHVALSRAVDAGRPVRWGRLRWQGDDGVRWSVRGGNRARPDDTWTAWSSAWDDRDQEMDLPASRYLQWRAEFDGDAGRVRNVSVSAWRDNLPPVIAAFMEERLGQIDNGGLVSRSDNVTQTMRSGLRVEFNRTTRRDRTAAADRASLTRPVRTFSWVSTDPDGDRIRHDLEYRADGTTAWRPIVEDSPEYLGSWDTSLVPDGVYRVRLTAADATDNPAALARSSRREIGPVVVDNTPPEVKGFAVRRNEMGFTVRFRAEDEGGVLAHASLILPDGARERLDPVDRICDSAREEFEVQVSWPPAEAAAVAEPWRLRLEVWDLAGNRAVAEGEAK
ncbi:MAG: hypothetical protein GY838_08410 [bacterium]|nr:hypothetical protein [bacterium]